MTAKPFTATEQDRFLSAFLAALLWSSTDDDGTPLNDEHGVEDMDDDCRSICRIVCDDFLRTSGADVRAAIASGTGYTVEQAGHDFALTRNHHGAGFWDRGLGDIGKRLTESAHAYGEVCPYIGDDGLIYTI